MNELPKPTEATLYSRPLSVTEDRANRYAAAARSVGAVFWYLNTEGDQLTRRQWKRTLDEEGFGYVQLRYENKKMWERFCEEEMRLAEITDALARREQARQYGVLRGKIVISQPEGIVVKLGKVFRRGSKKRAA